jgi:1,4-alpha-glucan branching enzyme
MAPWALHVTYDLKRRRGHMTAEKKRCVVFRLDAPGAGSVSVAGSFNGWSTESHPLRLNKSGIWRKTIYLQPGTYEYRFVVDGNWADDANRKEEVMNQFGSYNSVVRV